MDWVALDEVIIDDVVFNEVLTVTDRATKMVRFLPTRSTVTASQTAEMFHDEYCL